MKAELLEVFGTDVTVASSAWVSSGRGDATNPERVERLIKMLAEEGHETPFEHVTTRWRITAPQRIQVQLLRHRLASHNVASARYGHSFVAVEDFHRTAEEEGLTNLSDTTKLGMYLLRYHAEQSLAIYNDLLEATEDPKVRKRVRELAAFALPQGVISQQIMTINLRSLKNLLTLRCSPHAQKEIQEIAFEMLTQLHLQIDLRYTTKYFFAGVGDVK